MSLSLAVLTVTLQEDPVTDTIPLSLSFSSLLSVLTNSVAFSLPLFPPTLPVYPSPFSLFISPLSPPLITLTPPVALYQYNMLIYVIIIICLCMLS